MKIGLEKGVGGEVLVVTLVMFYILLVSKKLKFCV